MKSETISRRRILKSGSGLLILSSARTAFSYEANERLQLAIFGTKYNCSAMRNAPHVYNTPIIAACDPDRKQLDKLRSHWLKQGQDFENSARNNEKKWSGTYQQLGRGKGISFFSDVREMLSEKKGEIDALVVSQVDHMHGVACGRALNSGLPVCSERPVGLCVEEARSLRRLAAGKKLPVLYRSPGTASGQFRQAMSFVKQGGIGEVREAHLWLKRGGVDRPSYPEGREEVPGNLNWDAWLGPLAEREYHRDWMSYNHWRETSQGGLGTFGMHTGIFPFACLELGKVWDDEKSTIRVSAECATVNEISFPKWERIKWELAGVTLHWHHAPDLVPDIAEVVFGKLKPYDIDEIEAKKLMGFSGSLLIGSKGALIADDHSSKVSLLPLRGSRPAVMPPGERSFGLYRDWLKACRGEDSKIIADFDYGTKLSELIMLGNLATLEPERAIEYAPHAGRIINDLERNQLLRMSHRKGWAF